MLRLPHGMLTKTNGNVYFLAYGIFFPFINIMGLCGALLTKGTCTNNTIMASSVLLETSSSHKFLTKI